MIITIIIIIIIIIPVYIYIYLPSIYPIYTRYKPMYLFLPHQCFTNDLASSIPSPPQPSPKSGLSSTSSSLRFSGGAKPAPGGPEACGEGVELGGLDGEKARWLVEKC